MQSSSVNAKKRPFAWAAPGVSRRGRPRMRLYEKPYVKPLTEGSRESLRRGLAAVIHHENLEPIVRIVQSSQCL